MVAPKKDISSILREGSVFRMRAFSEEILKINCVLDRHAHTIYTETWISCCRGVFRNNQWCLILHLILFK